MSDKLTTKSYWNSTYTDRVVVTPVRIDSWKNSCERKIYELKQKYEIDKGSVLEIGGGGSPWLAFLTLQYPETEFSCLDFSEKGVRSLSEWKDLNGIRNLKVLLGDFFKSHEKLGVFDFVYSHGVVEHFKSLPRVLSAHSEYLSERGRMLTIIPNMSGILGYLTKWMNRDVYDIHVPHDLTSFENGHKDAGLNIIESGYLCSNNFGVLASCVRDKKGVKWVLYKYLSRMSKLLWYFENKVFDLPESKIFSPYIYVVCTRTEAQ